MNGGNRQRVRNRWRYLRILLARPLPFVRHLALKAAYRIKPRAVPCLPVTLDIEPNNDCNFKCPHCQVTHWSQPRLHLGRDSFERILDQFPGLLNVKLQGMGEPLLNRQMLPMLQAGEARGIPMSFTTNGSVMTPAIIEALLNLQSTRITLSLDGATADVFERTRVGGKFAQVCENIRRLVTLRGAARKPAIEIWTVVTRENALQLPDIVRLVKDLGVDSVAFQLFVGSWGKAAMDQHAEAIRVARTDTALEAALQQARDVARRIGMPLEIYRGNFLSRDSPCRWPWTSAYIASNGDVVPCAMIADSSVIRMGNVFEQPFRQIWNNAAYQQLREQIRTHALPDFCHGCYEAEQ